MKRKIIKSMACMAAISILLSGCGCERPVTDNTNYNFSKEGIEITNQETGKRVKQVISSNENSVEIYYDTTSGMEEIANNEIAQDIIRDSVEAVNRAFKRKVDIHVFHIDGENRGDDLPSSGINNIKDLTYKGNSKNVLKMAIDETPITSDERTVEPKIKLIITDFSTQVDQYDELATRISTNVIDKGLSLAILSVKLPKPLFIFAIGHLRDVSDYIQQFYVMDSVKDYNGPVNWTMMDEEHNVNCKLFLQNSGIMGIEYTTIEPVEQGVFRNIGGENGAPNPPAGPNPPGGPNMPEGPNPPENPNMPEGPNPQGAPNPPGLKPDERNNGGQYGEDDPNVRYDPNGSFRLLRPDHGPEQLKYDIDGTVNFMPDETGAVKVAVPPKGVYEEDIPESGIQYFAFRSLVWEDDPRLADVENKISGKAKLKIPFEIIDQIQLTDLSYKLETEYSDAEKKDKEFYPIKDQSRKNNIEVAYADNDGPTSAVFRIDNVEKTAIINIYVKDLLKLPKAVKLDIKFTVSDPGKIPAWVEALSKTEEYRDLKNFIDSLNLCNKDKNNFSDQVTVYLLAGNETSYKDATYQPLFSQKPLEENEEEKTAEE